MTRIALFLLTATLLAQSPPSSARRLALVIGNADYTAPDSRLVNSVRDAETMRSTLAQLGFTTHFAVNTRLPDLEVAVDRFISAVRPGDIALFYYSGHGIQLQDQNYLLPVDFQANTAIDAKFKSYPVARLLENLEAQGIALQIVILDACRNNPYSRGWRGDAARGLLPMTAGRGTYIAFATAPGGVASDNPGGRNGLFTEELAATLSQPGLALDQVFNTVRARVRQRSGNKQIPWSTSSIEGEFYFRAPSAPPPSTAARVNETDLEVELWRAAERLATPAAYAEYLRQYPTGRFATFAKLRTQPPAAPPPSTPPTLIPGSKKVNPLDGLTYIWIRPGQFMMGCSPGDECFPEEKPTHEVEISKGFWLGQTEVTQAGVREAIEHEPEPVQGSGPASGSSHLGRRAKVLQGRGLALTDRSRMGVRRASGNHPSAVR